MFNQVVDLSGGEKARLALAKMLLSPANLMILDEPTNHLDIPAKQMLESSIKNYDGTVLLVSHDRYFIDQVANRILYYHENEWFNYYGSYEEFSKQKKTVLPQKQNKKDKEQK